MTYIYIHIDIEDDDRYIRREPRRPYPCPIFSKRLYFFLGSPTLTMLPEGERQRHKERERGRERIQI